MEQCKMHICFQTQKYMSDHSYLPPVFEAQAKIAPPPSPICYIQVLFHCPYVVIATLGLHLYVVRSVVRSLRSTHGKTQGTTNVQHENYIAIYICSRENARASASPSHYLWLVERTQMTYIYLHSFNEGMKLPVACIRRLLLSGRTE